MMTSFTSSNLSTWSSFTRDFKSDCGEGGELLQTVIRKAAAPVADEDDECQQKRNVEFSILLVTLHCSSHT